MSEPVCGLLVSGELYIRTVIMASVFLRRKATFEEQDRLGVLSQLTIFASPTVITGEGCLLFVNALLTCHAQAHARHYFSPSLRDSSAALVTFECTFALR